MRRSRWFFWCVVGIPSSLLPPLPPPHSNPRPPPPKQNFNLIALKESQAVERLTRITILLAKVTILFLPVSLLTAYFSASPLTQGYNKKTYWTCFAVIMALSFLGLAAFGQLSGTVEGKPIYRSLSQMGWEKVFGKGGRGRGKGRGRGNG